MKIIPKVLLFNMEGGVKGYAIKNYLTENGIGFLDVDGAGVKTKIGYLVSAPGYENELAREDGDESASAGSDGSVAPVAPAAADAGGVGRRHPLPFTDEMLVMHGFDREMLDSFLGFFKDAGIESVSLKAVVTPTNADWDSLMLYEEIKKERDAMSGRK